MKCFFSIRIVLLAMIMFLPGVAERAQAHEKPNKDEISTYSITVLANGSISVTPLLNNGCDIVLSPNNTDSSLWIFPSKKYIEFIEADTSKSNNKLILDPGISCFLSNKNVIGEFIDNATEFGKKKDNRQGIIIETKNGGRQFKICEHKKEEKINVIIASKDSIDFEHIKIKINVNQKDSLIGLGDTIITKDKLGKIEIPRNRRASMDSVWLNDRPLDSLYYHYEFDNDTTKKDEIREATANLVIDSLPKETQDVVTLKILYNHYNKERALVKTKKTIITILNPKDDKAAGGWLSGILDNPWIVVIVVLIVAFIVCLMIALKGRYYVKLGIKKDTDELKNKYKKFKLKKSKAQIEETFDNLEKFEIVFRKRELNFKKLKDVKKTVESTVASLEKDQLESLGCEKVMVSIEINNDDIRCKVGDKYEKVRKVGLNDEVAPQMDKIGASDDSQKVQTESTESDSKTESNSETSEVEQPNSAAEQVFKCVSDHEIAEKLLDVFKKEFDKGETWRSDEIDDKLKKLGIRAVCNKWNKGHEEKEQVPVSDFSIEGLFKAIGKGYIGTKAKDEMDYYKKEEHKTYSEVLVSIATEFENKGVKNGYEKGVSETEARKNNEIAAKDEVIIAKDGEIRNLNEAIEGLKLEKGKEQKAFAEEKAKLERKAEDVLNALKELLQTLANNKFEVGSCESEDAIVIIGAIKESIEKGVNGDEQKVQIEQLKTENNNLQTELDAEKQKVQDTESAAAQKLKEQQDGYEAHIQNLKNEHQKALSDKEIEKNNAVSAKEQELNTAHQENVTKLNAEHGEEISRLKADHEEEIGILREEHSNNVTALESKHAQELKNKEDSYNTLLKDKDAAHGREVKQLNDDHEKVVLQKDAEITSLNATIQEKDGVISQKDAEAHLDCASYVEQIMRASDNIRLMIDRLCVSTSNAANNLSINAMNKVQAGFERFVTKAKQSHEEQWQLASCRMSQVIAELQECIKPGLKESGWVNIISYLNLYAGASKELNDLFKEKGLVPTELSRLYAEIQSFIGMFGVKVVVPNLLADTFDEANFEFANADQWISVFAPSMRPRDYETRIFDMSCIGYQIDGGEYVKPKVYFN